MNPAHMSGDFTVIPFRLLGLIIHFSIALFYVYTKFVIDSIFMLHFPESVVFNFAYNV